MNALCGEVAKDMQVMSLTTPSMSSATGCRALRSSSRRQISWSGVRLSSKCRADRLTWGSTPSLRARVRSNCTNGIQAHCRRTAAGWYVGMHLIAYSGLDMSLHCMMLPRHSETFRSGHPAALRAVLPIRTATLGRHLVRSVFNFARPVCISGPVQEKRSMLLAGGRC